MFTTIRLSATEAAKRIRKDLKSAFPGTKFSVRSDYFSQGSAVRVHYTDGPAEKAVEAIVDTYGGRGYDGMNEVTTFAEGELRLTENGPVVYTTGAFLSVSREITPEAYARIATAHGYNPNPRLYENTMPHYIVMETDLREVANV